jgi:acyl-CoA synthetase (AMP-forming)/AMP-acid ligase II
MAEPETIWRLLHAGAADAPAILAPGRPPLSYAGLRAQVEQTVERLNGLGIGRRDRVAIVLPNGPEMAAAFLAVAAGATTAPLNPVYRAEEFDFYLSDLGAKALLVEAGSESPAIAVAAARGIRVLRLTPHTDGPAGRFDLPQPDGSAPAIAAGGVADGDEVALVLHTSGTTARPKIVPLSQANICASAHNIARTIALAPADRCLNIMPLFHIHGLMAAVLASLASGASVACTPGFNALRFFQWMRECRPTWYTAVPTMHQAILARAARNQSVVREVPLRLVRSSSASLPPPVTAELEAVFGAPVIESYGMTEAAHQMASNPLPPAPRKPGTVGLPAGPEVRVMDEQGALLPPGRPGEVVIRGRNVTAGYENNPAANATAFIDGWLRTGDQGVVDADGYLTITGRFKEIINRGGEKVSPREVDDVLLAHPGVAQAVTFAIPHDKLGEEVAVAIVRRDGAALDEREVQAFARRRLADFKVPRRVVFVDELPKGATGKVQRIGLAERLGLGS